MIQPTLFNEASVEYLATIREEKAGAVYTKLWVVQVILDLCGYTPNAPLFEQIAVEPSSGDGSFLREMVRRLAASCAVNGKKIEECEKAIVAFELSTISAEKCRVAVEEELVLLGLAKDSAARLAQAWIKRGDFLLDSSELLCTADYVVGNPPYIRLEDLVDGGAQYRAAYSTMIGRSDIYVAFYEAGLRLLKPGGTCGFICADRWMFNQYGKELRKMITANFAVKTIVQLHHADAFESEVSAYPAITIIKRDTQGPSVVAILEPAAESIGVQSLVAELSPGYPQSLRSTGASDIASWFSGGEPWPLMSPSKMALLRRLEAEFPTLETTGANVGIGVATGADRIFITRDPDLVEADRLLPMAMASDVKDGKLLPNRHFLVNPWDERGLVDLNRFPRLASYLEKNGDVLKSRHVGKRSGQGWFRTIDRVNTSLTQKAKLYLPDIKGRIAPVLDQGNTYPHHNLYFIQSDIWEPEVLGGLLLSEIAQFFIESYGVRMRGGYLRFQAQYLRRIRVPSPSAISKEESDQLRIAFASHNVSAANSVAATLYGLTEFEKDCLGIKSEI